MNVGAYAGAITNNGIFEYSSSAAQTLSGIISGAGSLIKDSNASGLTLSAVDSYTGATTVNQGSLTLGAGASLPNTNTVTIAGGATLNLSGSANNQLVSGTQTGTLNVNGTLASTTNFAHTMYFNSISLTGGTLASTLSNTSGFGAFFINSQGRTITINGTGNTFSGAGVVGISSGGVLTLNTPLSGDTLSVTGSIGQGSSGTAGGLAKTGLGSVTISGNGTNYTGATTLNAGTFALSLSSTTASFASPITVNPGATLVYSPTISSLIGAGSTVNLNGALVYNPAGNSYQVLNGAVTVNSNTSVDLTSGGVSTAGLYLDGGLKGSKALTVTSHTNGLGLVLRTANNTYNGMLTVNGTASIFPAMGSGLAVGNTVGASMANASITVNGTMDMGFGVASSLTWALTSDSGAIFSMDALAGTSVVISNMNSAGSTRTLSVGNNNGSGIFSGVIANGNNNVMSFIKAGTGIQTLSGANTYTGTTAVNGGTLNLLGTNNSSAVQLAAGTMLRGTGTLSNGGVTFAGPATVFPGDATQSALTNGPKGNLTVNSADFSTGGTLKIRVQSTGPGGAAAADALTPAALTLGGTSTLELHVQNPSGTYNQQDAVIVNGSLQGANNLFSSAFNFINVSAPSPSSQLSGLTILYVTTSFVPNSTPTNDPSVVATQDLTGAVTGNPAAGYNSIYVRFDGNAVTPVTLDSFSAKFEGAGVAVRWTCVSEFQNAGFNVYRQAIDGGDWVKVNASLIAGRITHPDAKTYSLYDWAAPGVYHYKLRKHRHSGPIR